MAGVAAQLKEFCLARVTELCDQGERGLFSDYEDLRRGQAKLPMDEACRSCNRSRNRYTDVLPFDSTRVVLPDGGYINASLIQSEKSDQPTWAYIASQGPLANTVGDFWAMVYHRKLTCIVMLTKASQHKCAEYFPRVTGESGNYGSYTVQVTECDELEGCSAVSVRSISVSPVKKEGNRTPHIVRHYFYQEWPDHGVPGDSFPVRKIIHDVQKKHVDGTPVVVHCSAGIGRTGTFCVLDIITRRVKHAMLQPKQPPWKDYEEMLDVKKVVKQLRKGRKGMVQTYDQYRFCYTALLEEMEELARTTLD